MISCAIHDYVEIACLYRLQIKLHLKNGETIAGQAVNTVSNDNSEECILIKNNTGAESVVLTELISMQAITSNPHFDQVNFR